MIVSILKNTFIMTFRMKKMTTTNCQPSQNERAKKKQDLWLFILYKNIINVNVF